MDAGKLLLAALFFVIVIVGLVYAQAPDTLWTRTYGGSGDEIAYSVQQTIDGGYVIAGTTTSYGGGDNFYIVKTDSIGETLWTRNYGSSSSQVDYTAYSIKQTTNGDYIVAGMYYLWDNGYSESCMSIMKLDSLGDIVWNRRHYALSAARDLLLNSENEITTVGLEIAEINDTGSINWFQPLLGNHTFGNSISATSNGFIIGGSSYYMGNLYHDFYLAKISDAGTTQWDNTYGFYGGDEKAYDVECTYDGGYVLVGHSGPPSPAAADVYLVKTDSSGETIWTRTYGGWDDERAYAIVHTPDRGYLIGGLTESFGAGRRDIYIIRTDSIGNVLWWCTYGDSLEDVARAVEPTMDGGYIIAGYTRSFGSGDCDFYLIKTEPDSVLGVSTSTDESMPNNFALNDPYPNPFNAVVNVEYDVGGNGKVNVNVYNVLGEHAGTVAEHYASPGSYSVRWDAGELPSGVYFVRMETGEFRQTKKVVLLR